MSNQLDLLDAIANDPTTIGQMNRERIEQAIRQVAADHNDHIDPNLVRSLLSNQHGLTVNPRQLSATYSSLHRRGQIQHVGTTINTDTSGGNAGKPLRTYRWITS